MKFKITLLFLIIFFSAQSQEINPIQADRPDQTETPFIVPTGMFQVETGFLYQKNDKSSTDYLAPTVLMKYGINENFELRLITDLAFDQLNNEEFSGLKPLTIGFKVKIMEEKGILPKTSFIGHLSLPNAASSQFETDFFAPEFRFLMQHTLSDKISFSYNLGAEWDGFTAEPTFIYTTALGYSITDKFGSYIEIFGFAPQENKANHSTDAGFTYLISDNFMVDLSGGLGITSNAPNHFLSVGFSFRL